MTTLRQQIEAAGFEHYGQDGDSDAFAIRPRDDVAVRVFVHDDGAEFEVVSYYHDRPESELYMGTYLPDALSHAAAYIAGLSRSQ